MKYSKQVLDAMSRTIQAYEQSIIDLETGQVPFLDVISPWVYYGSSCRLCNAIRYQLRQVNPDAVLDCTYCILYIPETQKTNPFRASCVASSEGSPHMSDTFRALYGKCLPESNAAEALKQILQERLDALLARCKENGYIFVEVKK